MRDTRYNTRSSEWVGDMTVWLRENAEDNHEQMARLRRQLLRARERELTARQRQVLDLYYEEQLKMVEIAAELGVATSTVSRTIHRAEARLRR